MSSESNRSSTPRRSANITDRGVTVSDKSVVRQLVTPLRRYIPVGWFDWEPFGERPKSWRPDIVMFAVFLVITVLLMFPSPLVTLDHEVRMWAVEHKIQWLWDFGRTIAMVGEGEAGASVGLVFSVWCALRSRSIRPMLMFVLSFMTLAIILGMKHWLGRPLSQHPLRLAEVSPDGPMLFTYFLEGGGGVAPATAYPSGHAVNSILLFGLIVMLVGGLLPKWLRLTLLIAPPTMVFLGQLYTGQHWLTDSIAGYLLGILIIRSAKRVDWHDIPIGPLMVFEPATRKTILISTLLLVGVAITPNLPLKQALVLAAVLPTIGLIWLGLSIRAKRRLDAQSEAEGGEGEPLAAPEIPVQPKKSA
jgi:membrane-associated phospholipid phosphatase